MELISTQYLFGTEIYDYVYLLSTVVRRITALSISEPTWSVYSTKSELEFAFMPIIFGLIPMLVVLIFGFRNLLEYKETSFALCYNGDFYSEYLPIGWQEANLAINTIWNSW